MDIPDENITDAEIAALPAAKRTGYAENLLMQTLPFVFQSPDYKRDERKMRLAIRLKGDDTRFPNQFGEALYEQGKYDESLKYLNHSLKIESENSTTKIFIGINYLRVKRFKDARRIFTEVTDQYKSSFEGFYNLGLAHGELKDYAAAVSALQRAAEISPDDANTHYQLGYYYYKLGKKPETAVCVMPKLP